MKFYDIFGSGSGSTTTNNTTTIPTNEPQTQTVGLLDQVLGFNGQINFNDHEVFYDNDDFCARIKDTGAEAIRVPGGTLANFFDPASTDPRNGIPTPEMIANLYAKTSVKIIIVLNMISQTFDQELAWLRKIVSLGVNIFLLEMGNEFPNEWFQKKYSSVDQYAKDAYNWITGIKKVFPNVLYSIPGGNSNHWNQTIISNMKDCFLTWHFNPVNDYTVNGIVDKSKIDAEILADYNDRFKGIPKSRLIVTEYNLQYGAHGAKNQPAFADDTQKGIAAAYMMQRFKEFGVSVVLFHNICMAQTNGAIESTGKGSFLTATGTAISQYIASTK